MGPADLQGQGTCQWLLARRSGSPTRRHPFVRRGPRHRRSRRCVSLARTPMRSAPAPDLLPIPGLNQGMVVGAGDGGSGSGDGSAGQGDDSEGASGGSGGDDASARLSAGSDPADRSGRQPWGTNVVQIYEAGNKDAKEADGLPDAADADRIPRVAACQRHRCRGSVEACAPGNITSRSWTSFPTLRLRDVHRRAQFRAVHFQRRFCVSNRQRSVPASTGQSLSFVHSSCGVWQ
jgi:hypothetical protein